MRVRVELFGRAATQSGEREVTLELEPGASLRQAAEALARRHPALDWIPRSVRSKAREVEKAYTALEAELHRTPSEPEVAERMGISLEELHQIFSQVSYVNVLALDELMSPGEKGEGIA